MAKSAAKAISAWKELDRDPRFICRRTKATDTAAMKAQSGISAAKVEFLRHQNSVQLMRDLRDVQLDRLENYCKRLYSIAKYVWKSRYRAVSEEFCRSVFQDGILPEIEREKKRNKGFLDGQRVNFDIPAHVLDIIDDETSGRLDQIQSRLKLIVETDVATPRLRQSLALTI